MRSNIYWEDNDEIHILYFRKWYDYEAVLSFELSKKQFDEEKENLANHHHILIDYFSEETGNNYKCDFYPMSDTYKSTLELIKKEFEKQIEDYYNDQKNYYKSLYEHFIEKE